VTVSALQQLIALLAVAYHWQPSEIKMLGFKEAMDYINVATDMKLLKRSS